MPTPSTVVGNWRAVWAINEFNMGLQESIISGSMSLAEFLAKLGGFVSIRNQLLYTVHKWEGMRIGQFPSSADLLAGKPRPKRRSMLLVPGINSVTDGTNKYLFNLPFEGVRTISSEDLARPDQFRAALQVKVGFDSTRQSTRYLGGISDRYSAFENPTIDLSSDPTYVTAVNNYLHELENDWYLVARTGPDVDPIQPVVGLVAHDPAPALLGLQFPTAAAPAVSQGSRVAVYNAKRKPEKPGPTLNGQYTVAEVATAGSDTFIYLYGTEGVVPTDFKRFGAAQRVRFDLFNILTATAARVGVKRRGKPIFSPRVRSRKRLTHDA